MKWANLTFAACASLTLCASASASFLGLHVVSYGDDHGPLDRHVWHIQMHFTSPDVGVISVWGDDANPLSTTYLNGATAHVEIDPSTGDPFVFPGSPAGPTSWNMSSQFGTVFTLSTGAHGPGELPGVTIGDNAGQLGIGGGAGGGPLDLSASYSLTDFAWFRLPGDPDTLPTFDAGSGTWVQTLGQISWPDDMGPLDFHFEGLWNVTLTDGTHHTQLYFTNIPAPGASAVLGIIGLLSLTQPTRRSRGTD